MDQWAPSVWEGIIHSTQGADETKTPKKGDCAPPSGAGTCTPDQGVSGLQILRVAQAPSPTISTLISSLPFQAEDYNKFVPGSEAFELGVNLVTLPAFLALQLSDNIS